MGLFGNLFSAYTPEYPPLEKDNLAGQNIAAVEQELLQLVENVSDPLEVVPSDHAAYVFIGKPPKKFGLAWIQDGEVRGFFRLMQEHGVTPPQIRQASSALPQAYVKRHLAEHYTAMVGQRIVAVTVTESLQNEVHGIIDGLLH